MPLLGHAGWRLSCRSLPGYVTMLQEFVARQIDGPDDTPSLLGMSRSDLKSSLGGLLTQGAQWMGTMLTSIWSGGQALMSVLALLVVTPVVAFYMLLDWDRMVAAIDSWVPRRSVDTVRQLAREMDEGVSGFIRGQVSVCLILGAYYAIGLSVVGLSFGLLIGIIIGFISFIPYVGATDRPGAGGGPRRRAVLAGLAGWSPLVAVGLLPPASSSRATSCSPSSIGSSASACTRSG
jgi:predicted PurR-regulated permease PerM